VPASDALFLEFSTKKLRQFLHRIQTCLDLLTEEQIWFRGSDASNAVGNLCLHLAGNVRQWLIHGVGGAPDLRERDAEFDARGDCSKTILLQRLSATVHEACQLLEALPPADLTRVVRPQHYEVTVLEAIYHVVEHFAQHTGQILFATKELTSKDLGFYAHLSRSQTPPPPPAGQETP